MTTTLFENSRSLNPGAIVELFRFDATSIGGPEVYFCQGALESAQLVYGGISYVPVDVEFSGLETSGVGALPTPKLKVGNGYGIFQGIINSYGDMVGCTVQRVRTFRRFLDDGEDADPSAYYGPDTFRIDRKSMENPVFIEWELSASIDQEGKMLPGRQVIRDTCLWRYRSWTGSNFDYSKAQCPYTGSDYFDQLGNPVEADKDQCGRRLSDCERRFGEGNPLPYGGFPGAARVRG